MQSNRARVLVALGSIAAIVVLLIVFAGGGGDEQSESTVAATTTTTSEPDDDSASLETGQPGNEKQKQEPQFTTIEVVGGEPKGGVADLSYKNGDEVRLEVVSDVDGEIHVHGYDLFGEVAAGGKARFRFPADIDGVFEVELEASGLQLARLTVNP